MIDVCLSHIHIIHRWSMCLYLIFISCIDDQCMCVYLPIFISCIDYQCVSFSYSYRALMINMCVSHIHVMYWWSMYMCISYSYHVLMINVYISCLYHVLMINVYISHINKIYWWSMCVSHIHIMHWWSMCIYLISIRYIDDQCAVSHIHIIHWWSMCGISYSYHALMINVYISYQ